MRFLLLLLLAAPALAPAKPEEDPVPKAEGEVVEEEKRAGEKAQEKKEGGLGIEPERGSEVTCHPTP